MVWIYFLILVIPFLYRWYQNRKFRVLIFDRHTLYYTILEYISLIPVPGQFVYYNNNPEYTSQVDINLSTKNPVSFSVTSEKDEAFLSLNFKSKSLPFDKLKGLILKEISRITDKPTQYWGFLENIDDDYGEAINTVTPFFHANRKFIANLIPSKIQKILFHGPSGNGKRQAIQYLAFKTQINTIEITQSIRVFDFLLYMSPNDKTIDPTIIVLDNFDLILQQHPEYGQYILRWLSSSMLPVNIIFIATVKDITKLGSVAKLFTSVYFDYPNPKSMNQLCKHYFQRPYSGKIPKIPMDSMIELASTQSYEQFCQDLQQR